MLVRCGLRVGGGGAGSRKPARRGRGPGRRAVLSTYTPLRAALVRVVVRSKGLFSMGVADGVYMWRELGIDSGLMSRRFMEACREQIQEGEEDVVKSEWAR